MSYSLFPQNSAGGMVSYHMGSTTCDGYDHLWQWFLKKQLHEEMVLLRSFYLDKPPDWHEIAQSPQCSWWGLILGKMCIGQNVSCTVGDFVQYLFGWCSSFIIHVHPLQNIHLVEKWLPKLDKKLEQYSEGSHMDYRVYMSAEPAADRAGHIIPQGVLESSVKITNEPPTGMLANLNKAFDNFNQVCR